MVEGEISLSQKVDNGTHGRRVTFWIRDAKVKFDLQTESFQVLDISEFLALDFKTGI